MADLASTDLTLTVQTVAHPIRRKPPVVKVVFGDGALTYPSGGIPVPTTPSSWGLKRDFRGVVIIDQDDASGIVWKYDYANKKLRGYLQGITVSAAGAATVDDFALDTTAEPLATAVSLSLTNNTGAGVKYFGKLLELAAAHTIAAQTLYVEAIGD